MGYIKEPKGIDFEVIPRNKPDKEADRLLSEYIRKDKLKRAIREAKYGTSALSKKFDTLMEKLQKDCYLQPEEVLCHNMGYIKEPEGVDFEVVPQIKPDPEADRLVSEFLAKEKLKNRKTKDKIVAKAKQIIQKYEASHAIVSLQENPPSAYKREPGEDDLVALISDLTKEEAKEVSEFIRKLKAKGKSK